MLIRKKFPTISKLDFLEGYSSMKIMAKKFYINFTRRRNNMSKNFQLKEQ